MFNINYIQLFKNIPPELATMLIASLPIAELRVAIPVAIGGYKLSAVSAFIFSVIGNALPAIIIFKFIGPVSDWMMKKSEIMKKFFEWLFARTRYKFKDRYKKYGVLALVLFVAIPLPITGAWTGSLAAFLFGIPPKRAFWLILTGICLAGIIVSIITKFGIMGFGLIV